MGSHDTEQKRTLETFPGGTRHVDTLTAGPTSTSAVGSSLSIQYTTFGRMSTIRSTLCSDSLLPQLAQSTDGEESGQSHLAFACLRGDLGVVEGGPIWVVDDPAGRGISANLGANNDGGHCGDRPSRRHQGSGRPTDSKCDCPGGRIGRTGVCRAAMLRCAGPPEPCDCAGLQIRMSWNPAPLQRPAQSGRVPRSKDGP